VDAHHRGAAAKLGARLELACRLLKQQTAAAPCCHAAQLVHHALNAQQCSCSIGLGVCWPSKPIVFCVTCICTQGTVAAVHLTPCSLCLFSAGLWLNHTLSTTAPRGRNSALFQAACSQQRMTYL
jgi:hypothetical protein